MGLQSVLKTRAKTSKLFALQASPCKGSKPRVNLDEFVFSILNITPRVLNLVNLPARHGHGVHVLE
jgi:hypothetical protein